MTQHFSATPEQIGYRLGAIAMNLVAGTTDQLETAQSVQGQPYSLLRVWQPSSLSYVTLQADASGNLMVAGGTASGAGSTSVDATLKASTAVIGHVVVDSMPAVSVSGTTTVDANLSSAGSTRVVGTVNLSSGGILGGSTAVIGHIVVDSMPSVATSTAVDANLSSAGSTRLVGQVTIANPTTAVSVANPTTAVTISNPTTSVTVTNPSTAVDATLSSAGSTRVVGTVNVSSGVILSSGTQTIGTVAQGSAGSSAAPWFFALAAGSSANVVGSVALVAGSSGNLVGAVAVSSGVVLGAGSSANTIGGVAVVNPTTSVTLTNPATAVTVSNPTTAVTVSSGVVLGAGSTANSLGAVALVAGTTANSIGAVALVAGTTANTVGSVALVAGTSGNVIGTVAQGAGVSTASYWSFNSVAFSSGAAARTSVSTTVDTAVVAANAGRKALVIANASTSQVVALGLTTAAVTTALGGVSVYLQPTSQLHFGLGGDLPLFTGPVRGINITSTALGGGVFVTEFT
jgi:hypothetical protein